MWRWYVVSSAIFSLILPAAFVSCSGSWTCCQPASILPWPACRTGSALLLTDRWLQPGNNIKCSETFYQRLAEPYQNVLSDMEIPKQSQLGSLGCALMSTVPTCPQRERVWSISMHWHLKLDTHTTSCILILMAMDSGWSKVTLLLPKCISFCRTSFELNEDKQECSLGFDRSNSRPQLNSKYNPLP